MLSALVQFAGVSHGGSDVRFSRLMSGFAEAGVNTLPQSTFGRPEVALLPYYRIWIAEISDFSAFSDGGKKYPSPIGKIKQ